ncbi:hypothetical protein ACOL23_06595 [Aliarcobacter butzleri]
MSLDLLIPFGILLILVIYLIYTRTKFEKNIVALYEDKFDNWKKNSFVNIEKKSYKELVGLIFRKDDKINIELLDENAQYLIRKGKFEIKNIRDEKDE